MAVTKSTGIETRSFQLRAAQGDDFVLQGYVVLYNVLSKDLGGFCEIMAPGCFARTLASSADVLMTHQHNFSKPLARLKNGSLKLSADDRGLRFRAQLDKNIAMHEEVFQAVKTGLVDECSFIFYIRGETWNALQTVRTVTEAELVEVSVVSGPAYPETSASARALANAKPGANKVGLKRLADIDADYARRSRLHKLTLEKYETKG